MSTGSVAIGAVATSVGVVLVVFGASLLFGGPFFQAEQQSQWWLLGGSEESSAILPARAVVGLVVMVLGGILTVTGLQGLMTSFERGKDRAPRRE